VVFHPTSLIVYVGLLDGHVKAFSYDDASDDEQDGHRSLFSLRLAGKKSCRGLALNMDGSMLCAVGKGRALRCVSVGMFCVNSLFLFFSVGLIRERKRWIIVKKLMSMSILSGLASMG